MDDEQYFSKIQAEIQERTLADVGAALNTVKDPLSGFFGREPNVAVPTSSQTPEGEANGTVDFQKSVVATQRFDISEPGWEERLQHFVNQYLGVSGQVTMNGPPVYSEVGSDMGTDIGTDMGTVWQAEGPMLETIETAISPIPNPPSTADFYGL